MMKKTAAEGKKRTREMKLVDLPEIAIIGKEGFCETLIHFIKTWERRLP